MYPERHWRRLQGETVNNQYHLQEFLGSGGYGAVYKADEVTRNRLIREVAIKLIAPEEDETKAEKQLTELQAAVNIHHEHLICSYTSGECEVKEDEYLFIVMEIATTNLEKQRKTGKISPAEAREIVKATAAALNYLHQSNPRKVHRDIKPANLLYVVNTWKVSDFGLLREISVKNSARTSDRRGTTLYVPPEAYDGVVATGWDMWSLGIMTAEILTGITPFTADTEAQLMKKIMEEEPEIDWSKIPEPFTEIVRRCLEKERAKRWTAEQVLTALAPSPERSRRATPELTVPSPELTAPSPELTVPSPERSRRATPELKPAPPETTRVVSAVGMDYTNLGNLLAAKKWQEADEETARVMLKVAGREKERWLDTKSIDEFPCEDLRTIDQLWVKYSNGRFGFSVQKRIYQSLGGTREYNGEVWQKFRDKVGWDKEGKVLHRNDLTFSERAPEAHLPLSGRTLWLRRRLLFSRVETCKVIVPSPELTVPSSDGSRRATPEPKLAPPETTPMVSAVGMDYINLRNLLAAKKWQEADEETARVMLKVAGREKGRLLDLESIDNFPCEDLRTIDQLWVKYSNGRFGFSVQKRIYQSLGGTREYDREVWEKFGDQVGWRKNKTWLYYKDLTFSEKAPEAHLPLGCLGGGVAGVARVRGPGPLRDGSQVWGSLLSRRDLFKVPSPELTVPSPDRSRRATPEPKPAPPETTPMISAVGMDYTNLRNLLAAKKWREADEETRRVMLKVAGREKEGWLDTESIDNFPCEDLRTIDQLWVKYSNGHFGFSVQKRIYQSLRGTRELDMEVWKKFGDQVGWSKNNQWLHYNRITFSEKAPEAHLPFLGGCVWGWEVDYLRGVIGVLDGVVFLFSRVETCRL